MATRFNELIAEYGIPFSLDENQPPFQVGQSVLLVYALDAHLQAHESQQGHVVECRPYRTVISTLLSWRVFVRFGKTVVPVSMSHNVLVRR